MSFRFSAGTLNLSDNVTIMSLSGRLCTLSPSGRFVASVDKNKLKAYESVLFSQEGADDEESQTSSLKEKCCWLVPETAENIVWSDDSELILMKASETAHIFSVQCQPWLCVLTSGVFGSSAFLWSPDSRNVLALASLNVCVVSWSLVDKSVYKFGSPKLNNCQMRFSPNGSWLAVTEMTKKGLDVIRIYANVSWTLIQEVRCETSDPIGLSWIDEGSFLYWDEAWSNKLYVSLICGAKMADFEATNSINLLSISESSRYVSVLGTDRKIEIFSLESLRSLGFVTCPRVIESRTVAVHTEELLDEDRSSQYNVVTSRPFSLRTTVVNRKPIRHVAFSRDDKFLSAVVESSPSTVYVWDLEKLGLICALAHINPVRCLKWSPFSNQLAIATGTDAIFIWSPIGSTVYPLCGSTGQSTLPASRVQWNANGQTVLVTSKHSFQVVDVTDRRCV